MIITSSSSTPQRLAVLLNTNPYSLNLSTWANVGFGGMLNYKMLKEVRNGVTGYVLKDLSPEEKANLTNINFPASLHSGNPSTKAIIKRNLKKYFEFIDVQFLESPLELQQSSAELKIHIQISPGVNPASNTNSIAPNSYCHFLTNVLIEPVQATINGVINFPFPDGNYIWNQSINGSASDYLGLSLGNFSLNTVPFIHIKENSIRFLQSSGGFRIDPFKEGEFEIGHLRPPEEIATTMAHEIGHAFNLDHWGTTQMDYNPGNATTWLPIMGSGTNDLRYKLWSKGDNETEVAKNGYQDDYKFFIRFILPLKLRQRTHTAYNGYIQKPKWEFIEYRSFMNDWELSQTAKLNNIFRSNENKLSTNKNRLINTTDITFKDGLGTIEGLIGFPNDFDILKIILKEGDYEISEYSNSPNDKRTQLYLGLDVVKSELEASKHQLDKSENEIYNKTLRYPPDTDPANPVSSIPKINFECEARYLATMYPDGSAEGKSFLRWPARPQFWRKREPAGSTAILVFNESENGQFNTFRRVNEVDGGKIRVKKTCMIYLIAYGDHHDNESSNGFSSYGSLGKYFITIRKNGNNTNLNQLLPGAVPPNCYRTEKIKCIINNIVEDRIFFTQDPEDYASNHPYNNSSDHPNVKKYNFSINGAPCKMPFLLQGKEYGLNDTIDEKEKKELFAVSSQVAPNIGKPRIQEFIVAPEWDYEP
jgi:hypothetical protein